MHLAVKMTVHTNVTYQMKKTSKKDVETQACSKIV